MAYQIDFTASNYVSRSRRKGLLRLLLLAAIAGAAWSVYDAYTTYNQPTLNMKLAEYEAVARPIEEMNVAWDETAKEYGAMLRYYRLVWAANPTNFLEAMASADAPRLGRGFHPQRWTLTTGGKCQLDYLYVFEPGDKAEQARGLEAKIAHSITSLVEVVDGKVDVQGVQHENLLGVNDLRITARFALPDARAFPAKERALAGCVDEIAALRKRVQDAKIADGDTTRGAPSTAQGIMMAYLSIGKDKPGFPDFTRVLNVAGWFERADAFIVKNRIPGDGAERQKLKETWNKVGNARFPWQRFRALDNDELVRRTKALGTVSDGVKRFKGFLERRHADCRKKLEPFVEAYRRNDVFNKPLVESDLRDRVAKAAGIVRARVAFKDEPGAEPAVLAQADETFTFTWVRWTLSVGNEVGREDERGQDAGAAVPDEPLTLAKLAVCARRALELGPGYALDTVKVDFGVDGTVSGAVLEGLLPVKKIEAAKGAVRHVD